MTSATIAVFSGGTSAEREVSLGSGAACALALARSFPTRLFQLTEDALPPDLDPTRHVVFSTLHGTFGEDGGMQKLLDAAGVQYGGCDAAGQRADDGQDADESSSGGARRAGGERDHVCRGDETQGRLRDRSARRQSRGET